jgi:catecholate siderophore receptor
MTRFKRRPIAAAVLVLFSAPPLAVAQTQAPAQGEQTLPQVNVRAMQDHFRADSNLSSMGTDTPMRDVPQFINTVPQSLIRSQNATSIGDALRNVPGITYAAAEGGVQANFVYYMRGFPVNQDIFLDGLRDMGEYNRDLFATDTIEVLKGPSALMFGRGSTGGLINQVSKIADLLPRKEVAATFGSFDQKRLTADLNLRTGDSSAFRVVGLAEHSGSYRYPQDVDRVGIAPSARWGIGERLELMASYYYLKTKDVTDYGQPSIPASVTGTGKLGMPNVPATNYYGLANHDFADHETQIATFRVDYQFSRAVSLRSTLRWANYKRAMEATIPDIVSPDANGNPLTAGTPAELLLVRRRHDGGRTRDNDDDSLINQTDITWKFDTGSVRHVLLTGLELARERLHRWNYSLDANPATPAVEAPTSFTPFLNPDPYATLSYTKTPNLRANSAGDTYALYVQDQMELSRQWKLVAGLRQERFEADAATTNYTTGAVAQGPFARTDNMTSGRAGLIWQPDDHQSYYVSASNSFNPSGELGVYAGTAQTPLNAQTQNLDPEENRNVEVGAQWEIGRGLQLRSALFRTEKINQRIQDSTTGTLVLAGKRRVEGLELQLAGSITPNWDVYSGVAFMDGEIVKSSANQGNKPLGVPEFVGSLWTVYRLGGGWEVGGGLNANSGFWLNDANTAEVPSYVVFDATAAYVQKSYELRLNVYNLADELYYIGGYQNSGNRVIPGMPRAASLSLRFNFD